MTISSPEREAKKVKIAVDRNPVETSFEKWACDLNQGFDKNYYDSELLINPPLFICKALLSKAKAVFLQINKGFCFYLLQKNP